MNEWFEISKFPINAKKIYFVTNGKTVFMQRTGVNPFYLQLYGEYTTIADFIPTHWTTLPILPEKNNAT